MSGITIPGRVQIGINAIPYPLVEPIAVPMQAADGVVVQIIGGQDPLAAATVQILAALAPLAVPDRERVKLADDKGLAEIQAEQRQQIAALANLAASMAHAGLAEAERLNEVLAKQQQQAATNGG